MSPLAYGSVGGTVRLLIPGGDHMDALQGAAFVSAPPIIAGCEAHGKLPL